MQAYVGIYIGIHVCVCVCMYRCLCVTESEEKLTSEGQLTEEI